MIVKVMIPTPLRQYTGKKDTVEAEGKTAGEILTDGMLVPKKPGTGIPYNNRHQ